MSPDSRSTSNIPLHRQTKLSRRSIFAVGIACLSFTACSPPADKSPNTSLKAEVSAAQSSIQNRGIVNSPPEQELTKAPPIDTLVENLRKKLHANPSDTDGWVLLARSYAFIGDRASAEAAIRQARKLGYTGEDIDFPEENRSMAKKRDQNTYMFQGSSAIGNYLELIFSQVPTVQDHRAHRTDE